MAPVSATALSFLSSANYNYLRGYVSLEEEILLIKSRVKADDFIPAIRNNIQAIECLESNKFGSKEIERLNQAKIDAEKN